MYLTRDEAVAELVKSGGTEESARATLDSPLAEWPGCHRTSFYLITRYEAGTIMDAYYPGNPGIPEAVFTLSRW